MIASGNFAHSRSLDHLLLFSDNVNLAHTTLRFASYSLTYGSSPTEMTRRPSRLRVYGPQTPSSCYLAYFHTQFPDMMSGIRIYIRASPLVPVTVLVLVPIRLGLLNHSKPWSLRISRLLSLMCAVVFSSSTALIDRFLFLSPRSHFSPPPLLCSFLSCRVGMGRKRDRH